MTPFEMRATTVQRQEVTEYIKAGVGDFALAQAMLLGIEFREVGALWSWDGNDPVVTISWATKQRAAVAYCLTHNIPLNPER